MIIFLPTALFAQKSLTKNTLSLTTSIPAVGKIERLSFMTGSWVGTAFGGRCEEIWSEPTGNSMMGTFKLVKDGKTQFYEFLTIVKDEESLLLRLKHFTSSMHGWEKKDETVDHRLVRLEDNKVYFERMTFEGVGTDTLKIYLAQEDKLGKMHEVLFVYSRD